MSRRSGAVLLEVIIAMTILAIAAISLLTAASQSSETMRIAQEREREMRMANAFFNAVALWTRADLDRHLGTRPQGAWQMHVDRETPTLYVVTLRDAVTGTSLLKTSLYRPVPQSDGP